MNMKNKNFEIVYPAKLTKFTNINSHKMITALSTVALEMQKYHASTSMSCHNFSECDGLDEKLKLCQSDLRVKRKRIRKLKENLRKACIVAKTIMSAKENETMSLQDGINNARSECADLYTRNKFNTELVEHLKTENKALHEKIEHLQNFIRLGYEELQKMRNIPVDDVPIVLQLKEIILSCGQYYADFCNERDTCVQVEQKNRFLNNKINILGTNVDGIVEELKNVKYQNSKLRKENNVLKSKLVKVIESNVSDKEDQKPHFSSENIGLGSTVKCLEEDQLIDLSSHLSIVKNLLFDQDAMLMDLKRLSEELKDSSSLPHSTLINKK